MYYITLQVEAIYTADLARADLGHLARAAVAGGATSAAAAAGGLGLGSLGSLGGRGDGDGAAPRCGGLRVATVASEWRPELQVRHRDRLDRGS